MPKQDESNEIWKGRIKRFAIGVPIFLGVYLALILFYIHPHWPIDLIGWAILVLAGIPISLGLEWIGESVFSEKAGDTMETAKETLGEYAEKTKEVAGAVTEKAGEVVESTKETVTEYGEKAKERERMPSLQESNLRTQLAPNV